MARVTNSALQAALANLTAAIGGGAPAPAANATAVQAAPLVTIVGGAAAKVAKAPRPVVCTVVEIAPPAGASWAAFRAVRLQTDPPDHRPGRSPSLTHRQLAALLVWLGLQTAQAETLLASKGL